MSIKSFFTGTTRFSVEGGKIDVLNRLRKFSLSDIEVGEQSLTFSAPLYHKDEIMRMLRRETVTARDNKNVFRIINFFYTRFALSCCALAFICAFLFVNNLVFAISVTGTNEVQSAQIYEFIASKNLKTLTFKSQKKAQEVAQAIETNFDFVAHVSGKVVGNTVVFAIYSVEVPSSSVESSDIIARENGVVKEVIVASGRALVSVGDVVKKGDILIRGEYQIGENEWKACHAVGEVIAEVKYSESRVISDVAQIMTRTGVSKTFTDVFCEGFSTKEITHNVGFKAYSVEQEITSFILFLKFTKVRTIYFELAPRTQKVDLATYKDIVANEILNSLVDTNNITDYDEVETFFTVLSANSIAVEVVVTQIRSIV